MDIPAEWRAASAAVGQGVRRVMVLGPPDAGKSTFCRFLLEEAQRAGRSAALLDADVGQNSLGPPACAALAEAGELHHAFVGTTSPVRGWRRLIDGTIRLVRTSRADLLVVNTSGFLAGIGRRLKGTKIEAVDPHLLVGIGEDASLDAVLEDHAARPMLRLSPSPQARRKTDGERRAARREAFAGYFAGAASTALQDGRVRQALAEVSDPQRLLVGIIDRAGQDRGLGVVTGHGPEGTTVLTPVLPAQVDRIVPGRLWIDASWGDRMRPAAALGDV